MQLRGPQALAQRMVKLAREISAVIVTEYGTLDLMHRLADPFWFQAFGCVLGYDWHSSGVTTVVCGALKEAWKPISKDILVEVPDNTNDMQRVQVRAKRSNARLGHVFADPQSPTGRRYVVYSAAFRFVPVDQMKDRGYEAFLPLFDKK